ncbi:MAG TPA: radical SAM protein [Myxococcales bacterium]|nr:radical SAM protein [Myxococcales bacterium]
MKALLVQPLAPTTYWGFQHSLRIVGKAASLPPLGLVTLAALLPRDWDLRLVDLNVEPLSDRDLSWADALLLTGMLVHEASMQEVLGRAKRIGLRTVVGGPAATATPERFAAADYVFTGEAEGRLGPLIQALETGAGPHLIAPLPLRPELADWPAPRYDLLRRSRYSSMAMQSSRGCPFNCEFCDVIELFGGAPRVKSAPQLLRELDALAEVRWRGPVFFVDDNFIGNRRAARGLLPEIARWQREHGRPFEFYTEASVDLAGQPELVAAMVDAGFTTVFLGIETPSAESLRETHKLQNLKMPPDQAVDTLTRAGLEVNAGFIVGFDADGPEIFAEQQRFIEKLPVPTAMVGLLTALPGTALWRRLSAAGRLREGGSGDQFDRPNFDPQMDERALLLGYRGLLAALYQPEAYLRRCELLVSGLGKARSRPITLDALRMLARIVFWLGIASPRRRGFWRLFFRALRRPHTFSRTMGLMVQGEHLIRYTREDVLPRLDLALRELGGDSRASCPQLG